MRLRYIEGFHSIHMTGSITYDALNFYSVYMNAQNNTLKVII